MEITDNNRKVVQSVIFKKKRYSKTQAENWLIDHKFKVYTSKTADNSIRFKQVNCDKVTNLIIKRVTNNITFIIGELNNDKDL